MKKLLLWILNKFYNGTPCQYGLINYVKHNQQHGKQGEHRI